MLILNLFDSHSSRIDVRVGKIKIEIKIDFKFTILYNTH